MSISEHVENFGGKPVIQWESGCKFDPAREAARITLDWDSSESGKRWVDLFMEFLETPGVEKTTAFVVGDWGESASGNDSAPVVEALVSYREKLPLLESLFMGDIQMEESEISWINQSDVGPLFHAFPRLREFVVRGGNGLGFGSIDHRALQKLIVQAGGLDVSIVRRIFSSTLPELTHLELWLGEENYGATTSVEDFAPLFSGKLFPKLKNLGLRNSVLSDGLAAAIATSPIVDRIETLDLSLGTLGDEGAEALLKSPSIAKLKHLNIQHHYVSNELVKRLKQHVKSLDASDQEEPGASSDDRYVSVGE